MEVPCDGNTGGGNLSVNCPADVTLTINENQQGLNITYGQPTATTTCAEGGLNVMHTNGSQIGDYVEDGTYNITFTIIDACGNMEVCNLVVNVLPFTGSGCNNTLTGFTSLGEFGNSAYYLSNDIARPTDAQATAEALGGNLATISSQAENDFIWGQISELVYIGLDDYQTEGTLAWVDGSPVDFTNFDVCNFCNENSADMDFVVMHSWNGAWSWSNFYNSRKYIVEVPCTSTLTQPNFANTLIAQLPIEDRKPMLQSIVPNPAMEYIFTKIKTTQAEEIEIMIFDARGVLVKTERLSLLKGVNSMQVDISDLAGGFYSIYIPQAQVKYATQRFVKVRS